MRFQLLHGGLLLHISTQTALSSLYENFPHAARRKRKIRYQKTERMRATALILSVYQTSHRVRGSEAANKISSFFAAACTPQKTLCAERVCFARRRRAKRAVRSESPLPQKGCALLGQVYPSWVVFRYAASTASKQALRNAPRSRAWTPAIVLPPGLQTSSFSRPGCLPLCSTMAALPSSICAA